MSEKPTPSPTPDPAPVAVKPTSKRTVLDPVAVEAKLRELRGNQAAVARHFGVNRHTINALVRKLPRLRTACQEAREAMKDNAESALQKAVIDGKSWAVQLFLKTQAKDRGYTEKPEADEKRETPAVTEIVVRSREEAAAILLALKGSNGKT